MISLTKCGLYVTMLVPSDGFPLGTGDFSARCEEHFQAICKAFDLPDDYFLQQLSSPEVLEQETAIASAPVERKRRNRLLKGLLLCGLSLAMVILALVMTVSILVSIDLQMGHTAVNASTFGIPWIDRVILCAVLLIAIIAVMLFIILKPIIQKRKTQKNNKKSGKGSDIP